MKKFLFLTLVLLLLVGCANRKAEEVENINKNTIENFGEIKSNENVNQKIEENMSGGDLNNNQTTKMQKPNNIGQSEDLVSQFTQAIIKTNAGDIKVKFYNTDSPITVNNFLNLAKSGFYNDTKFHRVIKDFMIQGGDPNSKDDDWSNDGMGGPGYKFDDEFNNNKLVKGSLAMANSGPNTNGSQFFIVTADSTPWLDGRHVNFGTVVEGMDVVLKIEAVEKNERDHPTVDMTIQSIELLP